MDSTGRGLRVSVYRHASGDCTLGGVSATADELTIVGVLDLSAGATEVAPLDERSRAHGVTDKAPPVVLVKRRVDGFTAPVCTLAPLAAVQEGFHVMMGGNYAASSDSRFSRLIGGVYTAIAIHDRELRKERAH